MKLYGFWRSLASYRVRVALGLKGIAAEEISIDILKGRQFSDEYKALNPQSVVPALLVDGGAPLFQSLAILEYLEETHPHPALLPRDARGRARVRGLSHWSLKALEAIEAHLVGEKETGRFCHGDAPTMADICLAGQVIGATAYFNCDVSKFPAAMRIYGECMKLDAFARAHPLKQPGAPSTPGH